MLGIFLFAYVAEDSKKKQFFYYYEIFVKNLKFCRSSQILSFFFIKINEITLKKRSFVPKVLIKKKLIFFTIKDEAQIFFFVILNIFKTLHHFFRPLFKVAVACILLSRKILTFFS